MGTRSLTFMYEEFDSEVPFVCIYRQFDGYPEGHGVDLANFINSKRLVNGYSGSDTMETTANGIGCLAAQLVMTLKERFGLGGIYLHFPDLNADHWQDYEYHIWPPRIDSNSAPAYRYDANCHGKVKIVGYGGTIFEGNWIEFEDFCKNPSKEEN